MDRWKSALLVLAGACSYGILSTIVKLAYADGFDPGGVTGSQGLFGALLLLVLTLACKQWGPVSPRQWLALLGVGAFVGLTGVFYYSSLTYIPASLGIVLLFQFTWIGVLAESLLEKKRPSTAKLVSLVLLLAGTILSANLFADEAMRVSWMGILLGLLSAVTYAAFIMASGRLALSVNPWMRSLALSLGSFLMVCMVFPPVFLVDGSLGAGLWKWGLLLAVFGIVFPNLSFTYGVPRIGSGLATILGSAELPTATLLSYVILQEHVTPVQWAGVALILAGIVVAEIRLEKQPYQEQQQAG